MKDKDKIIEILKKYKIVSEFEGGIIHTVHFNRIATEIESLFTEREKETYIVAPVCIVTRLELEFTPTIINYDDKQVWRQIGQTSESGEWYDFDEVTFKTNSGHKPE